MTSSSFVFSPFSSFHFDATADAANDDVDASINYFDVADDDDVDSSVVVVGDGGATWFAGAASDSAGNVSVANDVGDAATDDVAACDIDVDGDFVVVVAAPYSLKRQL